MHVTGSPVARFGVGNMLANKERMARKCKCGNVNVNVKGNKWGNESQRVYNGYRQQRKRAQTLTNGERSWVCCSIKTEVRLCTCEQQAYKTRRSSANNRHYMTFHVLERNNGE